MRFETRRFIARGLSVALVGLAAVPLYARAVHAQTGPLSGFVFGDSNQNGTKDSGESFLQGVVVTATGSDGSVSSTTTGINGDYQFSGLAASSFRISFATPSGMQPAPLGPENGSSVQFVAAGGVARAAFADPAEYCQSNPTMAIVCFAQDFATGSGTLPALKTVSYNDVGVPPAGLATRLTMSQVGSTYGLAYHRGSGRIFQGAFFKRGVSLGASGLGAIYSSPASAGATTLLDTIPNTGTNPRPTPIPADYWTRDVNGFSDVHKVGLGDIDLSNDESTLYAVNLANNGVYSVAINADGTSGGVSAPMTVAAPSGCGPTQFHIFGLGISGVRGLVGGVCTGPTVTDLKAYVFEFSAVGTAAGLSGPIVSFPLNYNKGKVISSCAGAPVGEFLAWDTISSDTDPDVRKCTITLIPNTTAPQASLADLQVTDGGDLAIGLRDRWGDQTGYGILSLDTADLNPTEGMAGGDLLLACKSGNTWLIENGGTCGTPSRAGSGAANNQGPGGGEFYAGEFLVPHHQETALGSMLRVPGKAELVATIYDPTTTYEQGLKHFADTNGAESGTTQLTIAAPPNIGYTSGFLGKANGLGDLEALCDQAPIEIGNRVWLDANRDGQQNPAEVGIDGVAVELWKAGVKVGDATTAGGVYRFNATNVSGGVLPNMDYEVRIPNASGAGLQAPLANLTLTGPNTGADTSDSDATASATNAVIPVVASSIARSGQNNHTFDVGFAPVFALGNRVFLDDGAGGGIAGDGKQNGGDAGIANVTLKLCGVDGTGNPTGAALGTTTTDSSGYYRFDGLVAGTYVVVVDVAGSAGLGNLLSSVGSSDPESGVDRDDSGKDALLPAGSPCSGGIASAPVILGPTAAEPTGETDRSAVPDVQTDPYSNLTVDFGFVTRLTPTPTTPGATTINPTPNPNPVATVAPAAPAAPTTVAATAVAPSTVVPTSVVSTAVVSTAVVSTTVAPVAPTTTPPSATVVTVDPAPPVVDIEGDIALTGAHDDQLVMLSFLLMLLGAALWFIGGRSGGSRVAPSTRKR